MRTGEGRAGRSIGTATGGSRRGWSPRIGKFAPGPHTCDPRGRARRLQRRPQRHRRRLPRHRRDRRRRQGGRCGLRFDRPSAADAADAGHWYEGLARGAGGGLLDPPDEGAGDGGRVTPGDAPVYVAKRTGMVPGKLAPRPHRRRPRGQALGEDDPRRLDLHQAPAGQMDQGALAAALDPPDAAAQAARAPRPIARSGRQLQGHDHRHQP
jgi:hypothetical protein